MALKCATCNGVYSATQADGTRYFHVCPPLGVDAAGRIVPRPNARNENVTINPATGAPVPIAAGAGAATVPDLGAPGPVVGP